MATKNITLNTQSFINRDEDRLTSYFHDVNKYQVLTADEEASIIATIQQGGRAADRAKNRLVNANLRFVISVANKYVGLGLPLADLIQEGNIGLIEAVDKFDPAKGCRFLSFAVHYILKDIREAIDNNSRTIRIPGKKRNAENLPRTIEGDATINNNDDTITTVLDVLSSDSCTDAYMDQESLHTDLADALSSVLTPNEQQVITMAYGLNGSPCSLSEICDRTGKKYESVRIARNKAVMKLANSLYAPVLSQYLAA